MLRLFVFSDSHGDTTVMHDVLQKNSCDGVLHLGDCYEDMLELKDCYEMPIYGVLGNVDTCDGIPIQTLEVEDKKILMCHGHQFGVKRTLESLRNYSKEQGVDITLFGHTHEAYTEDGESLLLNPGSISLPRQERASYAVLNIENNKIEYEIVYL